MRFRRERTLGSVAVCLLAASPAAAQTIRGHLRDDVSDQPIQLGVVVMMSETGDSVTHALTDRRGYFSVTSPDPGSFTLLGSGFGYDIRRVGIFDLGMGGEVTVEFRLSPSPTPLDEILVELDRPFLEHKLVRNGFVRRYHRNVGGHFITPHDIERSPARTTEDLLLGIPGVAVQPISDDGPGSEFGRTPFVGDRVRIRSGNGLCDPTVYVDGVRVPYRPEGRSPATLTSVVPLGSVEAVEVYRRPSEVPMEYNATQTGGSVCGVLVFWTRGGER